MWIVLTTLLLAGCWAQVPPFWGIQTIDGFPLNLLRSPYPGTPPQDTTHFPTPVPLHPQTARLIYAFVPDQMVTGDEARRTNVIVVEGLQLQTLVLGLLDPINADCRAPAVWLNPDNLNGARATPTRRAFFTLPAAYVATATPHSFQWQQICLGFRQTDGTVANAIHTNLYLVVTYRCLGDADVQSGNINDLIIPAGGTASLNRFYCNQIPTYFTQTGAVPRYGEDTATPTGTRLWQERLGRTKCCGWRQGNFFFDNSVRSLARRFGVCINPKIEACCVDRFNQYTPSTAGNPRGVGKPFNRFREKCCFGGNATFESDQVTVNDKIAPEPVFINYLDEPCPCKPNRATDFCNTQYPFKPPSDTTGKYFQCCTRTKYTELIGTSQQTNAIWGKCYDPSNSTGCCDTGDIFDMGSAQCCKINGVQSINIPCPCDADSHCNSVGGQVCCGGSQTGRPVFMTPTETSGLCSPYANYPIGTGPAQYQPCNGQCMDPRFQICCSGHTCIDAFETCCNRTCCNKFTQRCAMGLGIGAPSIAANPIDFRVPFEVCTTTEALIPFKAVLGWFLPICLLFATLVGLIATLFFAKRQNTLVPLSAYEKSMFGLACAAILFGWPLYFSPIWKYGVVTVWVAFFTILAALSQIRVLNFAALILQVVLLIYLIDPFYGNEILTLAESRIPPFKNSVHGFSGVLHAIAMMYVNNQTLCTQYYDFFLRDPKTEDQLRWDNPKKFTFGFCQRDWYTTLGVLEVINLLVVFLLFFVTLITHIRNVLFKKAEKSEVEGFYN